MEPIRSLHLNTARSWRGGERQTLLLVEGLRQIGHDAEMVCPPESPLARRALEASIPVHQIPLRGELDLSSAIQLRQLIQRFHPQILQLHTAHSHTIGLLARLGLGLHPGVIVQRRVDFSIHRSGTPVLTDLKYQHGVQRYIAISHKIAAVLEQDGIEQDRIRVVHSGVSPLADPLRSAAQVRDQLQLDASTPLLGSVGALQQHKGHIHLVQAMAQLRDRHPRAHLVLIGDGKLDKSLRDSARKLGIEERVHRVGFQEDVASWLSALDLYIHPSLEEGLGTSILDALGAGRTVIASDVGGIPEVIEDGVTGRLVAAANPALLAEVIDQMLDDPTTAARLAETGKQRATSQFSAEAMVEGNIRVHRELLEELQSGESIDEDVTR